jgi:predicted methyltransferase
MLRHLLLVAAASLVICGAARAADAIPATIAAAVADAKRPDADKARDADRKPAESLAFAGIKPGQKIVEFEPGSGYFTRLFASVVGDKGHVYAVFGADPAADAPQRVKDFHAQRAKTIEDVAAAYTNITPIAQSYSDFTLPETVDVAWTSQNYHDFHNPAFGTDIVKFDAAVFKALKPGGVFIVIDHAAAAGAGVTVVGTLHRIEESVVKTEVEAAGFKLIGESDVLHNPADTHALAIFDPAIKGKTDQFMLAFQKPKQ